MFFEFDAELLGKEQLELYSQAIEQFGEGIALVADAIAGKYQGELLDALRRTPGAVQYPIAWTSERQRRAYFATGGFNSGIPYHRTDQMVSAWFVSVVHSSGETPAEISIANYDPKRPYVVGPWQQPYHAATGWYREEDVILPVEERMIAETADMLGTMLNTARMGG